MDLGVGSNGGAGSRYSSGGTGIGSTSSTIGGNTALSNTIGGATSSTVDKLRGHFFVETRSTSAQANAYAVTLYDSGASSSWNVIPVGTFDSKYYDASLSPNGRWAIVNAYDENTEKSTSTLFDLTLQTQTDVASLGTLQSDDLRALQWLDTNDVLIQDFGSSSFVNHYELSILNLDPTFGRHQFLGWGLSIESSDWVPKASPDGKWLAYAQRYDDAQVELSLASLVDGSGSVVTSPRFDDFHAGEVTWATDSSAVTFRTFVSQSDITNVSYRTTDNTPTLLPIPEFPFDTFPEYPFASVSRDGHFVFWSRAFSIDGTYRIPLQSMATGELRWLSPLDVSRWHVVTTTFQDRYLLWMQGGKIAYSPLRDSNGTEFVSPVATYLADFGPDFDESELKVELISIPNSSGVIYYGHPLLFIDLSSGSSYTDIDQLPDPYGTYDVDYAAAEAVYVTYLDNPTGAAQDVVERIGDGCIHHVFVSPAGNYVANTTQKSLHVLRLPTLELVNTYELVGGGKTAQVVFLPDESGIVVSNLTETNSLHFIAKATDGTAGFTTPQPIYIGDNAQNIGSIGPITMPKLFE